MLFSFNELGFHRYEKLEYIRPLSSHSNFITFLGHSNKKDKIKFRYDFLKKLLKERITEVKYETDENVNKGLKYFTMPSYEGHIWNLLQSVFVKIQLIFETIPPDMQFHDEYFFSEKTMKLFLLPHPYFLFSNGFALERLENFGFKFPIKCITLDDYINQITIMLNDIDAWIETYDLVFHHNYENFYKIVESTELPHHKFLSNIINNM